MVKYLMKDTLHTITLNLQVLDPTTTQISLYSIWK
jgi:hypothetical protein